MTTGSLLVVDDEESVAVTIGAILELDGYEVAIATSGADAMRKLHESEFDLVLADLRLDDALRDPQPEAGAFFVLGREERLENMWQVLFGDTVAGVSDLNVHRLGHQELRIGAVRDAR